MKSGYIEQGQKEALWKICNQVDKGGLNEKSWDMVVKWHIGRWHKVGDLNQLGWHKVLPSNQVVVWQKSFFLWFVMFEKFVFCLQLYRSMTCTSGISMLKISSSCCGHNLPPLNFWPLKKSNGYPTELEILHCYIYLQVVFPIGYLASECIWGLIMDTIISFLHVVLLFMTFFSCWFSLDDWWCPDGWLSFFR